jgi:hypothetical protein
MTEPSPSPAPAPAPTPAPAPSPAPSPTPAPAPTPSPAPAPTPAPAPDNTSLLGGPAIDPPAPVPADFPADWREKMAGGDAKELERLKRMASPLDVYKSYRAMEQKISSGEFKAVTPFPEKGSEAEQKAWRAQNNVPDSHDGYKIELKNGMVIGEADKPIVDQFAKAMHAKNWSNQQLNDAVQTYFEMQDAQTQQMNTEDVAYKQSTEDTLRPEWGPEYRRNINIIENYLGSLPDGLGEVLAGGRLGDGRKISADPRVMKWLLGLELERNPAATLVPAGGDQGKGLATRLQEIKKLVADRSSEYYRGPNRDALQKEYRDLIDAESRMKGSSRAA